MNRTGTEGLHNKSKVECKTDVTASKIRVTTVLQSTNDSQLACLDHRYFFVFLLFFYLFSQTIRLLYLCTMCQGQRTERDCNTKTPDKLSFFGLKQQYPVYFN